jgi:hypothetical protein
MSEASRERRVRLRSARATLSAIRLSPPRVALLQPVLRICTRAIVTRSSAGAVPSIRRLIATTPIDLRVSCSESSRRHYGLRGGRLSCFRCSASLCFFTCCCLLFSLSFLPPLSPICTLPPPWLLASVNPRACPDAYGCAADDTVPEMVPPTFRSGATSTPDPGGTPRWRERRSEHPADTTYPWRGGHDLNWAALRIAGWRICTRPPRAGSSRIDGKAPRRAAESPSRERHSRHAADAYKQTAISRGSCQRAHWLPTASVGRPLHPHARCC